MSEMWGRTFSCCIRSSQEPGGVSGPSFTIHYQHLEENFSFLMWYKTNHAIVKTSKITSQFDSYQVIL